MHRGGLFSSLGTLMKNRCSLPRVLAPLILVLPLVANAAIRGPYVPDSNTAFLYHLDEDSSATSAAGAVTGTNNLLAVDGGSPSAPILSAGILGSIGAPRFGNAATFSAIDFGLGHDGNGDGVFNADISSSSPGADAVSTLALTGADGAFTLEVLVKLPTLITTGTNNNANRELISLENSGLNSARPFQLAITHDGFLRFREFAGGDVTFQAAIPTSGPDAFSPDTWFHAAFTYDGEGTGRLYWTLLDDDRTEASLLASRTGLVDLPVNSGMLVVGNENRAAFGESVRGSIDEVRISSVARDASEFVFVPEPTTGVMLSIGALLLARRRRS